MAREKGMGNLQLEKSGRWTVRIGIKGKRIARSARTKDKDKAERFLQRMLAPMGLGDHRLPLAEVWIEYVKSPNRNELAQSTIKTKQLIWMHFAKWMEHNHLEVSDLAGVTPEAVAEYLACLRADLCASTYNNRVCILREIFRLLANKAGLEEDPWEGVKLRPEDSHSRRELSLDEIKRLLKACEKCGVQSAECGVQSAESQHSAHCTQHYNEWHTLFLVGLYTGLRLGDCCRLDWGSVNLFAGVIQLIPSKTKRHARGKPVTIPINPALREALEMTPTDARSGYIMPQIAELYLSMRWRVCQELARIFKAANITMSIRVEGRKNRAPEATFHSLRHTFVSFAANAGVPLHIVQSIVGHESTTMTRHYYHENIDALKSAVNAIPAL